MNIRIVRAGGGLKQRLVSGSCTVNGPGCRPRRIESRELAARVRFHFLRLAQAHYVPKTNETRMSIRDPDILGVRPRPWKDIAHCVQAYVKTVHRWEHAYTRRGRLL